MRYTDLSPDTLSFEIRYAHGYLYWDNFGKLYKAMVEKFPTLKRISTEMHQALLREEEKYIEIAFGPNKTYISQQLVKIEDFCEYASTAVNLVNHFFEIDTFTRVGCRSILVQPFKSLDDATKSLDSSKLFTINKELTKHLGKALKELGIRFVYHADDTDFTVDIKSVERKLQELSIPYPFKIQYPNFHEKGILYDFDNFSSKPVDYGILNTTEFIRSTSRKVKLFIENI